MLSSGGRCGNKAEKIGGGREVEWIGDHEIEDNESIEYIERRPWSILRPKPKSDIKCTSR
ncbi:hypothetical protein JCM31598_17970 [Desulfonatronum parangueonense]